ncbi:MAG: Arc family DNA-binding protein [Myxococcales bacterium]|nr:MAG: Arc family DNA-binding protein [Myxococcales bacterium]
MLDSKCVSVRVRLMAGWTGFICRPIGVQLPAPEPVIRSGKEDGRPMPLEAPRQFAVRFPGATLDRLAAIARANHRGLSAEIRLAVETYVQEHAHAPGTDQSRRARRRASPRHQPGDDPPLDPPR